MYISYLVKTQKQRLLELACDMKIGLEGAPWEGLRNESSSTGRTMYQDLANYERSWKPHKILILVFKKCNVWYFKISFLVSWWPSPPGLLFHLPHSCLTNYSAHPPSGLVEIEAVHSLVIWGLRKILFRGTNRRLATFFFPCQSHFKPPTTIYHVIEGMPFLTWKMQKEPSQNKGQSFPPNKLHFAKS